MVVRAVNSAGGIGVFDWGQRLVLLKGVVDWAYSLGLGDRWVG